jgi:hypothetical protein
MKRITQAIFGLALAAGLAVGAIASAPVAAQEQCRYEKTDYDGSPGSPQNCLGGECSAGWCCKICTS